MKSHVLSFLDSCQSPFLYYASDFEIFFYNVAGDNVLLTKIVDSFNSLLVNDRENHKILLYNSSETIYRISFDGSEAEVLATNLRFIRKFTYDGRNNVIYYLHNASETIHMIDLESLQESELQGLANVSGIRDVDFDASNK